MKLYDDMMPLVTRDPCERIASGYRGSWFVTLRHCPECGYPMVTNGAGKFVCNRCKHYDKKDVSKYDDLRHRWHRKREYGIPAHVY